MNLWDAICIHACYRRWNPISLILSDRWVIDVYRTYGLTYPGWRALRD